MWERLYLSDSGGQVPLVVPGPTNPTNQVSDLTEPYFWTPPPSAQGLSQWLSTAASVTLTINDGAESLSDAVAPTVAIDSVADGIEGASVFLSASILGGIYDELDYAWSVNGGTLNDATAVSPIWNRPTSYC